MQQCGYGIYKGETLLVLGQTWIIEPKSLNSEEKRQVEVFIMVFVLPPLMSFGKYY